MRFKIYLIDKQIEEADVAFASDIASDVHSGQFRKFGGEPYFEHPKRVAAIVKKYKKSKKIRDLIAAATLHDTIEDTDLHLEHIKQLFGALVASLVKELTSDPEEIKKMGKINYLSKKMLSMSNWALVIKLADRLDNVSDLDKADKSFAQKTIRHTERILKNLEAGRKLTRTQKNLVDAIRDKIELVKAGM